MSTRKITLPSGEVRWEVCLYTGGRTSKRITKRFERRSDADAFEREIENEKKDLLRTKPDVGLFEETTFKKESEFWLQLRSHTLSPGHLKRAKGVFKEYLPLLGSLRPNQITAALLTKIQTDELRKGRKADTVNRKIEIITSVLNFSVRHRRIPYNPAEGIQKLRTSREERFFLTEDEAKDFLSFSNQQYPIESPERWKHLVYLLAINAGLRAGEIWGLKVQDLSACGEIILIQRQFDRISQETRPTKGRKNRRTICNENLHRELALWIRKNKFSADDFVFQSETGTPINHDNFRKRVFEIDVKQWGGKSIRFHDLRHTAITLLVASGVDLRTVQEIAGHQDIKTTMGYTHVVAEKIKQVSRSFSIGADTHSPSNTHLRLVRPTRVHR
jgi:integrase